MAEDFLMEMLRSIQTNIAELGRRMDRLDARLTGIEDRMERIEKRQTAMKRFHQHVLVKLTGVNERLDNMTGQLLSFDRRIGALEARA
ncbi:hypothetical protein [Sphingomonas sp.]|uniref:hypothetical protein n=1 Tax=Sphingomonas sp. TaxID=28214 RepID=UPI003CC5C63E